MAEGGIIDPRPRALVNYGSIRVLFFIMLGLY